MVLVPFDKMYTPREQTACLPTARTSYTNIRVNENHPSTRDYFTSNPVCTSCDRNYSKRGDFENYRGFENALGGGVWELVRACIGDKRLNLNN